MVDNYFSPHLTFLNTMRKKNENFCINSLLGWSAGRTESIENAITLSIDHTCYIASNILILDETHNYRVLLRYASIQINMNLHTILNFS